MQKNGRREFRRPLFVCPYSDSNGDAHTGTGPQPAVYTNSTIGANTSKSIRNLRYKVKLVRRNSAET